MLQQTRVEAVRGYFDRWMQALPDIPALAAADEGVYMKLWEGLGYYSRVRNLHRAAVEVCAKYGGELPADYDKLLALPGIGEYTAGAIASIAFGLPVPAVDGNVLRVAARLDNEFTPITDAKYKRRVRGQFAALLPEDRPGDLNQALMELGAMVCLPNGAPLCAHCPLAALCLAHAGGTETAFPMRAPKKQRPIERRTVFLLWKDGRIALRKRPNRGLLAGMWEFPNVLEGEDAEQQLGVRLTDLRPLGQARHVFTHLEWHMTGVSARTEDGGTFTWVTPEQLAHDVALPSAFRAYRAVKLQD